tara:strand:+ start:30 stop:620 length:591 start_codon:yes stop_codon:yes gene_type:complete
MKRLLLFLILTFSFQSLIKANDIKDFEIEGMSIGDSLLDHLSKKEIQNGSIYNYPSSDEFFQINFSNVNNFKTYEHFTVLIKTNDENYIIYELSAYIDFKKNINDCYNKEKEIINDIRQVLTNIKFVNEGTIKKTIDKSGKSKITINQFYPDDGGVIKVSCHDWGDEWEKKGEIDSLSVSVASKKAFDWYINEAYK